MTNDDKDLKPCPFCGKEPCLASLNSLGYNDWQVWCNSGCAVRTKYGKKEDVIKLWNTRTTPQQPSEPLKELNEETIRREVKYQIDLAIEHFLRGRPYNLSEPALNFINERVENILSVAKFGQPSEKKALRENRVKTRDEIYDWMHGVISRNNIDEIITFILDRYALPARKEVKWPAKSKICDMSLEGSIRSAVRNEAIDACIAAYEEAMPAQREVRYPDSMANPNNYTDKSKGDYARGWNDYREAMKKLNGG